MPHKKRLATFVKRFPATADLWWALRGSKKPWSAHYKLSGLASVLPGAVTDVRQLGQKLEHPKRIFVFATLHYWIEQAGLIALALAGQGHDLTLAYLPYAEWQNPITPFDLRRQDLYTRTKLRPAEEVMKICSVLKLIDEGSSLHSLPEGLREAIKEVSRYDTMYTQQVESVDEKDPLYQLRLARNTAAASAFLKHFEHNRPDVLVIPNGTILEMGVAYRVARFLNIPVMTFEFADQRERIWLAQNDAIMSHNTTALWEALGGQPLPDGARTALEELYAARKNAKPWGDFARKWQANPLQGAADAKRRLGLDDRPMGLLATNVLGDSLTLGREKITPSMADWIVRVIGWFVAHPQTQLVVRVHPGELLTHGTSMLDVIDEAFPQLPENVHIIKPDDKTNTYDLMEISDFGLVFTTTVGLEMAMAGLPVLTAGKTHYAEKGFTIDPASWEEYARELERVSAEPAAARLSPKQQEQAWLYAYLFFFEFSLPFPWHLVWLGDDFKARPMRFVLNPQGQARYAQTFSYLTGDPLDWKARGLARLEEMQAAKEQPHD